MPRGKDNINVSGAEEHNRSAEEDYQAQSNLRRELERTRERGYSLANEEHEQGIRTVAVPVLDDRRRVVAALCLTAPAFRVSLEDLAQHVPALREAACEIAVQLPHGSTSSTGPR